MVNAIANNLPLAALLNSPSFLPLHVFIYSDRNLEDQRPNQKNNTPRVLLFGRVLHSQRFVSLACRLSAHAAEPSCQPCVPVRVFLHLFFLRDFFCAPRLWCRRGRLTRGSSVPEQHLLFCDRRMGQSALTCDLQPTLQFVSFNPLLLAADRLHCGVWACRQAPVFESLCVCLVFQ